MANFALLAALLFATAASADRLEVLGPTGFVSPDGFEIAVRHVDAAGQSSAADANLTV